MTISRDQFKIYTLGDLIAQHFFKEEFQADYQKLRAIHLMPSVMQIRLEQAVLELRVEKLKFKQLVALGKKEGIENNPAWNKEHWIHYISSRRVQMRSAYELYNNLWSLYAPPSYSDK